MYTYIMSGMVRCLQCGAPMWPESARMGIYCSADCQARGECGE
jgi:hypothetical protein